MKYKTRLLIVSFIALSMGFAAAQDYALPEAQAAEVKAEDGLMLIGDYYPVLTDSGQPRPAVLLLHMIGSNRHSWQSLIPSLWNSGYSVLTVDLRGFGDTGGEIYWSAATADVQAWLDWLQEQPELQPDAISIIGASIGSNLALIGCANDAGCVTAIALSPGLDYYGLEPRQSIVGNLSTRSALLVASQIDHYSTDSVKEMVSSATGDIGARLFAGNAHGTNMLLDENIGEPLLELMIDWLNEHMPAGN